MIGKSGYEYVSSDEEIVAELTRLNLENQRLRAVMDPDLEESRDQRIGNWLVVGAFTFLVTVIGVSLWMAYVLGSELGRL